MRAEDLQPGVLVQHFKRQLVDQESMIYVYKIVGVCKHTETKELLVVYSSMYDKDEWGIHLGDMFARPIDMFLSLVDNTKYPEIHQTYRFEPFII